MVGIVVVLVHHQDPKHQRDLEQLPHHSQIRDLLYLLSMGDFIMEIVEHALTAGGLII